MSIQRELSISQKQLAREPQLQADQAAEVVKWSLGASQRMAAEIMEVMSQSKLYQLYIANREGLLVVMPWLRDIEVEGAVQLLSDYRMHLACKARRAPRKQPASRYASEYEEWLKVAAAALKGCQVTTSAGRKRVATRAIEQTGTRAVWRTISAFVRDHWSEIKAHSHTDHP